METYSVRCLPSQSLFWLASLPAPCSGSDFVGLPRSCHVSRLLAIGAIPLTIEGTIQTNFFLNFLFALFYGLTAYFYLFTMTSDPGFVPKSASRSASKAVIDELMELRQFDEHHFCVNCMVRKPLRSKDCKRCERCVAKSDQ